jgi:hypothetical protein
MAWLVLITQQTQATKKVLRRVVSHAAESRPIAPGGRAFAIDPAMEYCDRAPSFSALLAEKGGKVCTVYGPDQK